MCFEAPETKSGRFFRVLFVSVGAITTLFSLLVMLWKFAPPLMVEEVQAADKSLSGKYIIALQEQEADKELFTWNNYFVVPKDFQGTEFKKYQDSIATSYQLGRLDILTAVIAIVAAAGAFAGLYGAFEVRKRATDVAERVAAQAVQDTLEKISKREVGPKVDRETFIGLLDKEGGAAHGQKRSDDGSSDSGDFLTDPLSGLD